MSKTFGFPVLDIYNYDPRVTEYQELCFVPNADLPKFDGNMKNFDDFKNRFFLLIGRHRLNEARKVDVLKMCLTGIARKYINFLPSTVDQALEKLKEWLEIHQHLLLADLPSLCDSTSSWELYEFWAVATRLLTKLNMNVNVLVNALKKKLPFRLAQRLSSCCEMKDLMHRIHRIARTTMRKENLRIDKEHSEQKPALEFCKFCLIFSCHQFENCPVYNTANRRKLRAKALKICYACLEKGHSIRDCQKSSEVCYRCRKKHTFHAFLCNFKPNNK